MYLDPGFGGMLLQVLVAIIAAGGAILFSLRKRIRSWLSNRNKKGNPAANIKQNPRGTDDSDGVVDTLSSEDKLR